MSEILSRTMKNYNFFDHPRSSRKLFVQTCARIGDDALIEESANAIILALELTPGTHDVSATQKEFLITLFSASVEGRPVGPLPMPGLYRFSQAIAPFVLEPLTTRSVNEIQVARIIQVATYGGGVEFLEKRYRGFQRVSFNCSVF